MSLDIWDIVEISNDQRSAIDEPAGGVSPQVIAGTIMSFLRFQMSVADLTVA